MENVIENFDYIMEKVDDNVDREKYMKIELMLSYLRVKSIMKTDKAQKIINDNIVKEKGKHYIKGTRISTNNVGDYFCANKLKNFKELLKEYPSLDNEDQVIAAMFCYLKDNMNLLKIMFIK